MGDIEIELSPGKEDTDEEFDANLAEFMDESALDSLGSELVGDFTKDIGDRKDWIQTYVDGLKLLGLKYEDRTEPWQGACGVFHPMLTESVVRFQSEGIMETFPAAGPVKTQILGKDTPEKEEASTRVREDMNYQLTDVMVEYRPEHEKLLWNLPLAGSAFKKVYYDPSIGRQVAMFIPAEDIVVPYGASNLERAERVTHVMRKTENEITKLQEAGFYMDVDLGDPSHELDDIEKQKAEEMGMSALQDDRFRILEMHVDLDLKGYEHENKKGEKTGIALPYVVTVEKATSKILAIRRNWYEGDELHTKRQHFVHYQYIPGFGFYGYGLIHLIGGYAKSATMLIRQLVDAGTLSNLPGGLKSRGLRIKGDDTPIAPGEFRDVDVPSGSIRDNILPLPYKEPSQVLYTLFQNIVQEGRQFASAGDMKVSDMSAQAPVGTTLAILERTLKVMGAVQARMHYSMKQEFKLLKAIIADYTPEDYDYEPIEGSRKAKNTDGLETMIPTAYVQKYMDICARWEQLTNLSLEHDQYTKMVIRDVNNYIAVTAEKKAKDDPKEGLTAEQVWNKMKKSSPSYKFRTDGTDFFYTAVKCKGAFEWEDLHKKKVAVFHKNKSFLIIPKAIHAYFVYGTKPEEFLAQNTNILDYCAGVKSKGGWYFETRQLVDDVPEKYKNMSIEEKRQYLLANGWEQSWSDDNWVRHDAVSKEANTGLDTERAFNITVKKLSVVQKTKLQKIIRYFVSNQGNKIIKCHSDGREIQVESGPWLQTVINRIDKNKPFQDYDLNLKYYLEEIYKQIDQMEKIKPKSFTQLSLF